jgi:hypothetical protein
MITMDAGRMLGNLRMEQRVQDESEGAGSRRRTDYRPVQTPVLNDGRWHYWMIPGEDYGVRHDGTGWRVTCWTWTTDTHVYRLASADMWEFADRLPVDDGTVTLNPGRAYTLRHTGPDTWALHES